MNMHDAPYNLTTTVDYIEGHLGGEGTPSQPG